MNELYVFPQASVTSKFLFAYVARINEALLMLQTVPEQLDLRGRSEFAVLARKGKVFLLTMSYLMCF